MKISIFSGLILIWSANVQSSCPAGWVDSVQGCYLFHFTKYLTWGESQQECEKLGGYLAEPKTPEEVDLLTSLGYVELAQLGLLSWWIGLTDLGHENRWIWQHSMEDVHLTNWAAGAPNGGDSKEDCVVMQAEKQFKWVDENCFIARASPICQWGDISHNSTTKTTPTTELSTTPSFSDPYTVELRGGDGNKTGNVFARNLRGFLGPVCDDSWIDVDAQVVCRQLGFPDGLATSNSHFGLVPDVFAMDNVFCTGSEAIIQDCSYIVNDDCSSREGAGVICFPTSWNGSLDTVMLRGGHNSGEGNVFASNSEGKFGPVCDDSWGVLEAQVVCRQLGYQSGIATSESQFGLVPHVFSMDDVNCNGSESILQECSYTLNDDCGANQGAGVICYSTNSSIPAVGAKQETTKIRDPTPTIIGNWDTTPTITANWSSSLQKTVEMRDGFDTDEDPDHEN